jgi:DNA polymerase I
VKRTGKVRKIEFDYEPYFYLYLSDPHSFADMIEALETRFRVEECVFSSIYREMEGFKIYCRFDELREIAEKIELQTRFKAELYNVDIRADQRFLAERFPLNDRFNPDFKYPELEIIEIGVKGERSYPSAKNSIVEIRLNGERLCGSEREILHGLSEYIQIVNPDVILFPDADYWMDIILKKTRKFDIDLKISRNGRYRRLSSKSYFSYGRTMYRPSACIPAGRILIDTENSFNYREGGLRGVLLASRLTSVSTNYAVRFTPGTLISAYEVYEALIRGIAVPLRKRDAENLRTFEELKMADRGGMIFQPEPGIYEDVYQLDFTSMYPAIIVKHNLSPECSDGEGGFLSEILEPLLRLRIEVKRKKKDNPEYSGIDSILKWMLVTCFGYTGYRNARFGRIEVHESITRIGREILLRTKEIAESMGFEILHGIVDCLWVKGDKIEEFRKRVEEETGLLVDIDHYHWIVFLPMSDKSGTYNSYYGRLDGGVKVRGIAARRRDTPEYIKRMQQEILEELSRVESIDEIHGIRKKIIEIYMNYREKLRWGEIDPQLLAINRRISKLRYSRRCAERSAIKEYRKYKIRLSPGVDISFVVTDAKKWKVALPWNSTDYDRGYYLKLLEKAWNELSYIFNS